MRALILAAGRGSRLGDATAGRPKALVHVLGRPLLQWQLDALRGAGIDDIALVRGYRGELFAPFALTCIDNPRWATSNMVRSLLCAAAWLEGDDTVVAYGDIVYQRASVEALLACPHPLAVSHDPHWLSLWSRRFDDPCSDAESFRLGPGGRITEIGRPIRSPDQAEGQYMGLLRLTRAGWSAVRDHLRALTGAEVDALDMTTLLGRLVNAGHRVQAVARRGPWGEVDSPRDLQILAEELGRWVARAPGPGTG